MILPLQGDALMGAVTPRALPWARRLLAFQAAKIAEGPYPSRQAPYPQAPLNQKLETRNQKL